MPIYSYADATASLSARLGHRTDLTATQLNKWVDQAQYLIATNVRGVEAFDRVSGAEPLVIGQSSYSMTTFTTTTPFWAISKVRNNTDKLLMRRGEFENWISMQTIPSGVPSMWIRNGYQFYIFQAPSKATTLIFYFRALPDPGQLIIPDDWFDHLVQLAQYYALTEIGKSSAKADIVRMLPQQLQLALSHPMNPMDWEATMDSDIGVYPLS